MAAVSQAKQPGAPGKAGAFLGKAVKIRCGGATVTRLAAR